METKAEWDKDEISTIKNTSINGIRKSFLPPPMDGRVCNPPWRALL